MSEAKHTPGPWVQTSNFRGQHGIWPDVTGTNTPICFLTNGIDGKNSHCENWEANARLIASAPELLAALDLVKQTFPCPSDYELDTNEHYAMTRVYAAIAKSKGK